MISIRERQTIPTTMPIADEAEAVWEAVARSQQQRASEGRWIEPEGELSVDVFLTDNTVTIRTAVAGVRPQDMNVSLFNDLLTIRGERYPEGDPLDATYLAQECHWGSFSRTVVLPVPVAQDATEAEMKNGILTIVLTRVAPASVTVRTITFE